jgi:hypothetical protein
MRTVIAALTALGLAMLALVGPVVGAAPDHIEFTSLDAVTRWISNYRAKPEPLRLPAAVRTLSQLGTFKDPESSGVYVGFIAGVISANPDKAEDLIGKMFPMAAPDQWAIVRAIAYSGIPNGKICCASSRRACRCGR